MTQLTWILLGCLAALLAIELVLRAFVVKLGVTWMQSPVVSWGRLYSESAIMFPVSLIVGWMMSTFGRESLALSAFGVLLLGVVDSAVIAWLFKLRLRRAFVAWCLVLVFNLLAAGATATTIRRHWLDAYRINSNSMAPTFLGEHLSGRCPTCGGRTILCIDAADFPDQPSEMICVEHFHLAEGRPANSQKGGADRFLVLKNRVPQRWDIVAFEVPDRDRTTYAARLVGLPGETITLQDGAVFADGKKIDPPADLKGLTYPDVPLSRYAGHVENPAVLGPEEFFVLGDFSPRSRDSRFWEQTSSIRPPYALPKTAIVGVATHIYWPPSRWRAFY